MRSVFRSPPLPPPPAAFNMADYVLTAGRATPDKPALEIWHPNAPPRVHSFAEIEQAVLRCAAGLKAQEIAPQDRVLLRLGNDPAFPITYLAALWIGAVPVPTSAQLTTPEITRMAAMLDPALIVSDGVTALPDPCPAPVVAHADLQTNGAPAPHLGDPDRLGYIIFTSGTTLGPRGVCHAHRAIWARQMMFDGWYGLTSNDRLMHAGAFNWTYTLGTGLMDPWTRGATALIPAAGTKPGDLLPLIEQSRTTIFAAAPGVYRQMLKGAAPRTLPDLRHGLSAGEKLKARQITDWTRITGCHVHEALGMSECSTFISDAPDTPAPAHAAGWPQPGRHLAALGPDGTPVPRGEPGILAVHHSDPGLFLGYLDAPRPGTEWFETGDTISMAEDGAITYLGRADDLLNAGGFRVSPVEIEAAFGDLDGIGDTAAIALTPKPDVEVIALVYEAETPLDPATLQAHAERHLARYKQPRLYIHRPVLPKGANGKLNRKALRAALDTETEQETW